MNNGIYSATAGMLTSVERLNIISNNIANINTTGFKSDLPFEKVLRFVTEGPYPGKDQPVIGGTIINFKPGQVTSTGRKLDIAITDKGFFEVQGPNKENFYTRNGAFYLNSKKEITTVDGFKVLDKFGKSIKIVGEEFNFSKNGDLFIDGEFFTKLKVVDISQRTDLKKRGNYLFELMDKKQKPSVINEPDLALSALERSNSEIMKEIGNMISAQRAYEFQQRALETILFESIKKTINSLPRPN